MDKLILKIRNKKKPYFMDLFWSKKEINGKLDRSFSLQTVPVVIIK